MTQKNERMTKAQRRKLYARKSYFDSHRPRVSKNVKNQKK